MSPAVADDWSTRGVNSDRPQDRQGTARFSICRAGIIGKWRRGAANVENVSMCAESPCGWRMEPIDAGDRASNAEDEAMKGPPLLRQRSIGPPGRCGTGARPENRRGNA